MLPIDRVVIVGCGGNGSIMANHVCRIQQALIALGGVGFEIVLVDDDRVSASNLVRQCFCRDDLGLPKADVLAQRLVAFYGARVAAVNRKFDGIPTYTGYERGREAAPGATIIVGCVDNIAARRTMAKHTTPVRWTPESAWTKAAYWLDLGNSSETGQVVLGGSGLPTVFEILPDMSRARDADSGPSCSAAEALSKQDLFINSTLATHASQLLWKLIRTGVIEHHGFFINLARGSVAPLPVPAPAA